MILLDACGRAQKTIDVLVLLGVIECARSACICRLGMQQDDTGHSGNLQLCDHHRWKSFLLLMVCEGPTYIVLLPSLL
jgi:hypothetical protein